MNAAITAGVGLVPILTQTIGTAVSSVVVSNAFSATYNNYKILVSGAVGSMNNNLNLKLGSTTTGYYWSSTFTTYLGVYNHDEAVNGSFFQAGTFNTNVATINLELLNPFASLPTLINGSIIDPTTTGRAGTVGGYLANTTSYTDFTLITQGGTITGGTVYVYGYKK
jgi:hypothetical protein